MTRQRRTWEGWSVSLVVLLTVATIVMTGAAPTAQAVTSATTNKTLPSDPVAFITNATGIGCGQTPSTQSLQLFDLRTQSYERPLTLPYCAWGVAVAPNRSTAVIIGYTLSYAITFVNLHTRKIGTTIFFPLVPLQVVYSANSELAYVLTTQNDAGMVYVVDVKTGKILASQSTLGFPHDIALGLRGKVLLVDTDQSPTIQALTLPGLSPEKTITMPGDASLNEAVTKDGNTDWFLAENYGTGNGEELTPLDLRTMEAGKPILISNTAGQLLLNPGDRSAVLVGIDTSDYAFGQATIVSLESGTQRTVNFPDYNFGGAFVDNHGRDLYVTRTQNFSVQKVDLVTGEVGPPITLEPQGSLDTVVGFAQTPSDKRLL